MPPAPAGYSQVPHRERVAAFDAALRLGARSVSGIGIPIGRGIIWPRIVNWRRRIINGGRCVEDTGRDVDRGGHPYEGPAAPAPVIAAPAATVPAISSLPAASTMPIVSVSERRSKNKETCCGKRHSTDDAKCGQFRPHDLQLPLSRTSLDEHDGGVVADAGPAIQTSRWSLVEPRGVEPLTS